MENITPEQWQIIGTVLTMILTAVISIVGYLLKQSYDRVIKRLDSLEAQMDTLLSARNR